MKKLIICLQILFLSVVLKAADTVSAKYFPLAVGNKWVYFNKVSYGGPFIYFNSVTKITKDTVVNNKKYFFVDTLPRYHVTSSWIRYDSTNGHLNIFSNEPQCNYERILYDLSAVLNDSCNGSFYHAQQKFTYAIKY